MTSDNADDHALYRETVPVFLDYAPRIVSLARLAADHLDADVRLVPDTFSAGEHLVVAQGFMLRTVFPVIGRVCPELSVDDPHVASIVQRQTELAERLGSLREADFAGSASRRITHVAGDAQLTQSAADYVRLFGMPNVFFHMTLAYATLRLAGVTLGKAQFDGLHRYAAGFSFQNEQRG